jgi:hypothetical protein
MKKLYIIILAAFIGFTSGSKAQTYAITPNDTLVGTAPFFTITIFDIFQDNISGAPLNLGWTLISNNLVPGWDFSLCDYNTCYTGLPASGTMATVPDSGQGFLGLNVDPTNISGTGTVRIYVYDMANPNGGDTLTWIVSTPPVGINDMTSQAGIQLYPNPATDVICVNPGTNAAAVEVVIVDATGREVFRNAQSNNGPYTIPVSELAPGNYVLMHKQEDGTVIHRQFIRAQ